MEYLVRFVQVHESFRKPELDALAGLAGVHLDTVTYSKDVRELPRAQSIFCNDAAPDECVRRSDSLKLGVVTILHCPAAFGAGSTRAHCTKCAQPWHL